ncbi:MAG: GNAT family N-acetyltransferase [Actinomycetota bacterium]|nr:GNAT family N-acetyltransferase [Actinomycetota bacterium]
MLDGPTASLPLTLSGPNGSLQIEIGPLRDLEVRPLFDLFGAVIAAGEGYAHAAPLTWASFEETWLVPTTAVVAARSEGGLVGAYYLKPNGPGRVAHVANAGYVVAAKARRRGIARALVVDSIERARLCGFDAMQFNLVFADNPARPLYEALGFEVVGRLPKVISGQDALIYFRSLSPASAAPAGAAEA